MDSGDSEGRPRSKKRTKTGKACNPCRSKRVKCESSSVEGLPCVQCAASSKPELCVYRERDKRRALPKGYVAALEARQVRMDLLLERLFGEQQTKQLVGETVLQDGFEADAHSLSTTLLVQGDILPDSQLAKQSELNKITALLSPSNNSDNLDHFSETTTEDETPEDAAAQELFRLFLTPATKSGAGHLLRPASNAAQLSQHRRHFFWQSTPAFEKPALPVNVPLSHAWPDKPALDAMIAHYYQRNNNFLPVIRRSFLAEVFQTGRQHVDPSLCALCFAIFASAYTFTNLDGLSDSQRFGPGFEYFHESWRLLNLALPNPGLYGLYTLQLLAMKAISAASQLWMETIGGMLGPLIKNLKLDRPLSRKNMLGISPAEGALAYFNSALVAHLIAQGTGSRPAITLDGCKITLPSLAEFPLDYYDLGSPLETARGIYLYSQFIELTRIHEAFSRAVYGTPAEKPSHLLACATEAHLLQVRQSVITHLNAPCLSNGEFDWRAYSRFPHMIHCIVYAVTHSNTTIYAWRPFIHDSDPTVATRAITACMKEAGVIADTAAFMLTLEPQVRGFLLIIPSYTAACVYLAAVRLNMCTWARAKPIVDICLDYLEQAETRFLHAGRVRDVVLAMLQDTTEASVSTVASVDNYTENVTIGTLLQPTRLDLLPPYPPSLEALDNWSTPSNFSDLPLQDWLSADFWTADFSRANDAGADLSQGLSPDFQFDPLQNYRSV